MSYDFRHEANTCTNELFYRDGPTPKVIQMTDAEYVRDVIERYLREAAASGQSTTDENR